MEWALFIWCVLIGGEEAAEEGHLKWETMAIGPSSYPLASQSNKCILWWKYINWHKLRIILKCKLIVLIFWIKILKILSILILQFFITEFYNSYNILVNTDSHPSLVLFLQTFLLIVPCFEYGSRGSWGLEL